MSRWLPVILSLRGRRLLPVLLRRVLLLLLWRLCKGRCRSVALVARHRFGGGAGKLRSHGRGRLLVSVRLRRRRLLHLLLWGLLSIRLRLLELIRLLLWGRGTTQGIVGVCLLLRRWLPIL